MKKKISDFGSRQEYDKFFEESYELGFKEGVDFISSRKNFDKRDAEGLSLGLLESMFSFMLMVFEKNYKVFLYVVAFALRQTLPQQQFDNMIIEMVRLKDED